MLVFSNRRNQTWDILLFCNSSNFSLFFKGLPYEWHQQYWGILAIFMMITFLYLMKAIVFMNSELFQFIFIDVGRSEILRESSINFPQAEHPFFSSPHRSYYCWNKRCSGDHRNYCWACSVCYTYEVSSSYVLSSIPQLNNLPSIFWEILKWGDAIKWSWWHRWYSKYSKISNGYIYLSISDKSAEGLQQ